MEEPNGHVCPECGAPRTADNSPSCACARRAAAALHATRTTEAAAAEDFDPLRIRPYVDIDAGGSGAGTESTPAGAGSADHRGGGSGAEDHRGGGFGAEDAGGTRPIPAVEATMPLRAVGAAGAGAEPRADDLSLFDSGGDGPQDAPPRRGRRPVVLLALAAAAVAVVVAAGYAGGLFSYESPARDDASAHEVREGIPDGPARTASSAAPAPPAAPSAPSSARPSPSPSGSPSTSPSVSPPATASASASPSASRTAPGAPSTAPTQSATSARSSAPAQLGPVLRPGDHGPQVADLQSRLAELYLYSGPLDGDYDRDVENSVRVYQWARGTTSDGLGVYGPATRASLESET